MSQNTRLLLIALVVMVVLGIFLQSLIARSLQESFGTDNQNTVPQLPRSNPAEALPGIEPVPGAVPLLPEYATKKPVPARDKREKGR